METITKLQGLKPSRRLASIARHIRPITTVFLVLIFCTTVLSVPCTFSQEETQKLCDNSESLTFEENSFHTLPQTTRLQSFKRSSNFQMKIVQVPVLSDNYSYLIVDEKQHVAAAVDPAEPEKVISAANKENVEIVAVLTTHHHWDHAGGNDGMKKQFPTIKVYGGDTRVNAITDQVKQDDTFEIGSAKVKVHFTPCHTSGHVLYEVSDREDPSRPLALFTGDTLFIAGCGRFFEGTADQMVHALLNVVGSLPGNTQIFCGHEYTVKNLQFAQTVEPDNEDVKKKLAWAQEQRNNKLSTVPSTVEDEKKFNPFMRVEQPSVKKAAGLGQNASPIEVMAAIRKMKDNF